MGREKGSKDKEKGRDLKRTGRGAQKSKFKVFIFFKEKL